MLAIIYCACSFKTLYLHYCASKWKIWQLAPHHEYNVLFLIVLGAATQQQFTRGGLPQVAYISLHPLRLCKHIDQTQGPMSYPLLLTGKVSLFSLSPLPMFKLFPLKEKF